MPKAPAAPAFGLAIKAAEGAAQDTETPMTDRSDFTCELSEPVHESSPTARVLEELALYGYRPAPGEPDPRPLPDPDLLAAAVSDLFGILAGAFRDTKLETDLEDLLWGLTDLFHKKAARVQALLDENGGRQKRSAEEQDGSEVRSVELERLLLQGEELIERHNAIEELRNLAAERFEAESGSAWRPRAGSLVNRKTMTAALIDSRDYLAARRRAETEIMLPKGPKIVFSGGIEYADHAAIWATLDKVLAKHSGMVLVHGGSPKGAEKAASRWADTRKVAQIAFKPDWTNDGKAAPFKRNDRMLELMPKGAVVFPGSGITANLADKAKKLGIPVLDRRASGA